VGSDPVLSQKAGTLPLIFLNNLGYMLDGPFIDRNAQRIFQTACAGAGCQVADARSISRLTLALIQWSDALKNIETAGIDAALASKISQAIPKIKTALQFTTRAMSGDLTQEFLVGNERRLRVQSPENSVNDRASTSAELIGTLLLAERTALNSEVLRDRIVALANGHAAQFFVDANTITSSSAVLWNARLIRQLGLSKLDGSLPWYSKAKEVFKNALADDWVEP
jgi:hypothetical protein